MDIVYMILLGATITWILFCTGVIHVMRFTEIHREKKRAGLYVRGVKGSFTSNSKPVFHARIDSTERKITKMWLHGFLRGCMPSRNDVIYLQTEEERIPVIICRIKKENMQIEMDDIPVSIKIAGLSCGQMRRISSFNLKEKQLTVTNLRKLETVQTTVGTESAGNEGRSALRGEYPIIVRTPWRERIVPAVISVMGILNFVISIVVLRTDQGDFNKCMIMLFISFLYGGFGLVWLFYEFSFRLKITGNQVEIRKFIKNTTSHINNLIYTVSLPADKSERWNMTIQNKAYETMTTINSNYKNYEAALAAFRQAAELRRQEAEKRMQEEEEARLQEKLRNYLLRAMFYIPVYEEHDPDTEELVYKPHIQIHKETGICVIFLYDNEAEARSEYPGASILQTLLENAIPLIVEYKVQSLIIWSTKEDLPNQIEITEETWQSLVNSQAEFGPFCKDD